MQNDEEKTGNTKDNPGAKRKFSQIIKDLDPEKVKILNTYTKGSNWTVIQIIAQEIISTYIIKDPESNGPVAPKLRKDITKEIELRFKDELEIKDILIESVPRSDKGLNDWKKKDGWDEAVWSHLKVRGLFTAAKRAEVIEALRKRAVSRSDSAAKLYLTLSGDYSEKIDINQDGTLDKFREINALLHKGKNNDD